MDRWVVKGEGGRGHPQRPTSPLVKPLWASGQSRIGDLSGDSSVRGARIRGVLLLGRVQAKGGCRLGESNRVGRGLGSEGHLESVEWPRGRSGRSRADKPRWVRILAITGGSSMAAMSFKVPPHCGHCSMSISNTRLSNRAQLGRGCGYRIGSRRLLCTPRRERSGPRGCSLIVYIRADDEHARRRRLRRPRPVHPLARDAAGTRRRAGTGNGHPTRTPVA